MKADEAEAWLRKTIRLTPRELDVFSLLSLGIKRTQIAAMLRLSLETVKRYIYRIYNKTGMGSHIEVWVWARAHRLIY